MLFRKLLFFVPVLGMITLAACTQSEPAAEPAEDHAVHWGYTGEGGPEHWGEIDGAYEVCGAGVEQSPIDIAGAEGEDLMDIVFNYEDTAVNILNNGHTVQVNYDQGSRIEINDTVYNLAQFHFHSPSEHELDGQLTAAEMHLVHKSEDGAYAVVGVMIKEGDENSAFADVWSNLPAEESEAETIDGLTLNAANLLPETLTYYNYAGSFTTPPCTEGVSWFVLTTPITMSAEQITAFHNIIGDNNRPVQPINTRDLVEDTTSN